MAVIDTKQTAPKTTDVTIKTVHLFLDGQLVSLKGNWKWEMHTDDIFCSNIPYGLHPGNTAWGSKCLIHPDDVEKVKQLLSFRENSLNVPEFRVVTPAGAVKAVTCNGSFIWEEIADFSLLLQQQELEQFIREKSLSKEIEHSNLSLKAYEYAGQLSAKGIWYINTVTHEAFYSDNVYRLYGIPPQSLNAHINTFAPFIHPDEKEFVLETLEKAYQEYIPTHLQFRIIVDGNEKLISQTTRWMFNTDGQRIIYGVVEDGTEAQMREDESTVVKDELFLKNELLGLHEKMNRVATWHINLFTRQIVYSNSIYKIYGLKSAAIAINNTLLLNFVHPDDRNQYTEAFEKIFKEHLHPDMEFRITRPDGKTRHLRQKGKMMINSGNEMVMLGVTQDVTDEVNAEKKLAVARNNLFLEKFALAHTEEAAGVGSWIWELDTGEVKWSEGLYTLLGYTSHTINASQKVLLGCVHPDDKEKFTAAISATLHDNMEDVIKFRILRKAEIRYITTKFKLLVHDEQRYFVGLLEDKTHQHLLEQRLHDQVYFAELLTDASPELILVLDVNNYVIKWNSQCEKKYGIRREKAFGKNIFELFPKLKTPEVISHFMVAQKGERVYIKNEKSILSGGYINLLLAPVKDDAGSVLAVLVMIHDVTTEYKLQEELSDRLGFIERLLEVSVDRIIALDRNMNYIYWNKKAEEYYTLKKEEVLGKNILELFPAFITDPTYSEFRKALRGEIVHISASENLAAKKGYFETYLVPVKGKKNEVTSILWIVHNLEKEYLVQRHQQRVAAVMDAMNENLFELDDEYRFIYLNPKAEDFLGVRKKEVIGKTIWSVLPNTEGSHVHHAIDKALKEGIAIRDEFVLNPKQTVVFASIAPTEDGVVVVFFEMEDLGQVQRKLNETLASLNMQAKVYKHAEDIANMGTWTWNPETNETFISDKIFELFGMDPQDVKLNFNTMSHFIHPGDKERMLQFGVDLKEGADAIGIEYRIIRKDGIERVFRNKMKLVYNDKNERIFVGTTQDITENKKATE